jgi:arylsulfatase A-like enzyme
MRNGRWAALTVALMGVVGWYAWPRPGPNLLLITVDALRPDRLSCYGGSIQVATLNRLAAEGVLVRDVVTDVPWTTPALATILSGVDASRHRLHLPEQVLADGIETLAQRLQHAGWDTAAVVGAYPADRSTGLARGFAYYDDRYNAPMDYPLARVSRVPRRHFDDLDEAREYHAHKVVADSYRTDGAVTDAATAWLARHAGGRFFLWVHYFGAHEKRDQRRAIGIEMEIETLVSNYPQEVERIDGEIGRLLAALAQRGWTDRTLVVVLGDHGQSLMEHDALGHGADLYEPSLRVPWLMRFPARLAAGQQISKARTVDMVPTVAALLGVAAPAAAMGRDVLAQPAAGDAYAETYLSATAVLSTTVTADDTAVRLGFVRRAWRSAPWKFIRSEPSPLLDTKSPPPVPEPVRTQNVREELYNLDNDPAETTNVIEAQPQIAEQLRQRLQAHVTAGGA